MQKKQPIFLNPIYIRAPDVKEKSNDLIDIYVSFYKMYFRIPAKKVKIL